MNIVLSCTFGWHPKGTTNVTPTTPTLGGKSGDYKCSDFDKWTSILSDPMDGQSEVATHVFVVYACVFICLVYTCLLCGSL
jgi:hypothetical protein